MCLQLSEIMCLCELNGSTSSNWPDHPLEHTAVLSVPWYFKTNLCTINLSCQESWATAARELATKHNATSEWWSRSEEFVPFARQQGWRHRLCYILCSQISPKAQHLAFKLSHILAKTFPLVDIWVVSAKDRVFPSPVHKFQLLWFHSVILVLFSMLGRGNASRPS